MDRHGEPSPTATADPDSRPPGAGEQEGIDPLIGAVLAGRYTIRSVLGRGGMGAVYRASSEKWGECAVKTMRPDGSLTSKDAVRRFLREARASLAIQSEHVVRVFEIDVDAEGRPFLAMQLLAGCDLSQQIRDQGPLDPAVAATLLVQACRGLGAAHRLGIVHRDVKPANLFLHEEEGGGVTLKVCDFGIAKRLSDPQRGDASTDLTHTGGLVGSPAYMSPEQAQNAKTTDHRTDVWSLAVTFHEALCGQRLWSDTQNLGALLVTLCTRDAPSLHERAPWVPEGLATAIHRGLQRDPALRYATVEDLEKAVAPFAAPLPLSQSSLAPIAQRDQVARLSSVTAATAAPPGSSTLAASATRPPDSVAAASAAPSADASAAAVSLGNSASLASRPADPPAARPRWWLPAGAAAGLVLVGAVALRQGGVGSVPAPPLLSAVPAASAPPAPAASPASASGAASGSELPAASASAASSVASSDAPGGASVASASAPGAGKKKAPVAAVSAPPAGTPKTPETATPITPAAKKPATKEDWQ